MSDLSERLQRLYTGVVFDSLSDMGLEEQALPPAIQALDPARTLAGPVWTVSGVATPTVSRDQALRTWTEFLSRAPAGHVVVCQPNDSTLAHMGELSSETLKVRGVLGYVVDGGCRDVDFILRIAFPVFCRYTTPADIAGRWRIDEMGGAVRIGRVLVRSGDYLIGDRDGAVVVPRERAEAVIAAAEAAVASENKVRQAILAGEDPKAAFEKYGKF